MRRSTRLAEEFKHKILLAPEETRPVMYVRLPSNCESLCLTVVVCSADRNLESASFIHMRHGKLILVAITRDNTNVFLILKYLHNLIEVSTAPTDSSAPSVNRENGEACFV